MTLPTGIVTFLFTDVEGSTKQWDADPDAMGSALRRHDSLMRDAIESSGGIVFKTIGDAFCAAFSSASDALHAALHAQLQMNHPGHTGDSAHSTEDAAVPMRVRMALHTGVAEERDADFFGPTLNRVARLLSLGYGGQVLLSRATWEFVQDRLPPEANLLDLGQHYLRDLVRAEHVFQLQHPHLPADFPPLKSLEHLPNNLPRQVTSFVGREQELMEVKRFLETTCLLTLTGSGGCGKTRLSLQVAADMLEEHPDGVWFVELAPLTDPALVPQTVAEALGLRETPGEPITRTLLSFLKERQMLLVLDNCEHVLQASARLVDALLKSCAKLRVLVSSREALGIGGESAYRVTSLSVPSLQETSTPQSVSDYAAVRLFIDRAVAAKSDFSVTSQNASALASVCRRLDGIPLAIELAAARVRSLSVEEVNTRLNDCFRLLTGGSRTALPRQQTLRSLIDWSYDLLNAEEKTLLQQVAVFAGGWTLEAAEQLCGEEALDLMTSLVDKSLAVAEMQGETTRYRLLETVRQYARDRLVESGESAEVRRRHQAYFAALAEAAAPQMRGPQQGVWLERLESEHDNLRAALEWSDPEMILRIASALWQFWSVRGYVSEGREWLAGALAGAEVQAPTALRARALYVAGAMASSQGDYATARTCCEESLAIYRESGNTHDIAVLLHSLGINSSSQGDHTAARTLFAESLAIHREAEYKPGIANVLHSLGMIASREGDYAAARAFNEESLAIHRELGHARGIANVLHSLGIIASGEGDAAAARTWYAQSLTIYRELGHKRGIANLLHSLGMIASREDDYAAARALYVESLAIHRELGNRRGIANSLEAMAALAAVQEQPERAAQLWGAAEALRSEVGAPLPSSERTHFALLVEHARAELSEEMFTAAQARGRALTLEHSTALALKDIDS